MIQNHPTLKKAVCALFALFALSFSENNPDDGKTINLLELEKSELKLSEIAESIEYVALANNTVLSPLDQVVFANNYYFVKDHKSKFLRFDTSGNFINKIGNKGKGPGEYLYVSDFVVHPDGNIYINGGKENKIMVYSPEGNFLRSFEITQPLASCFALNSENFFLFYGPGAEHIPENMELTDTEGKVLTRYKNHYKFERGRSMIGFSAECLTYIFEGNLHFKEIFSDTLFYLNGSKLVPKIIFNSGERKFTPEARTKMIEESSLDPRDFGPTWKYTLLQNNLLETNNYLILDYSYNKKVRTMVYNKTSNEAIETENNEGILNDLDGGPNIKFKMKKDDNTIFAWVDAYEIIAHVQSDEFKSSAPKYPEKKEELKKLANSLSENDNPVLILVKLKE